MKPGDRVKHSAIAIRPKRDYWLGCGRAQQKSAAEEALNAAIAARGTLLDVAKNKYGATVARVQWDSGTITDCLEYMVEEI
jgi:hypothetical protein